MDPRGVAREAGDLYCMCKIVYMSLDIVIQMDIQMASFVITVCYLSSQYLKVFNSREMMCTESKKEPLIVVDEKWKDRLTFPAAS